MSDVKIGQLITGDAQRDAIHVAIAPMVAAQRLLPGQHVTINEEGLATLGYIKGVGVVDPFLQYAVEAGQRFYLFLYPNTVTSLRHEWTHPAFDNEKTEAMKRLEAFAANLRSEDYSESYNAEMNADWVIGRLREAKSGSVTVGGCFEQDCFQEKADSLWNDYEIVTGDRVPREEREDVYFSCSC